MYIFINIAITTFHPKINNNSKKILQRGKTARNKSMKIEDRLI